MSDVTASYGTPLNFIVFLGIFIHNWQPFMSEVLYLHQTFTDCVFNQNTLFCVKCNCMLWKVLWFNCVWNVLNSSKFNRLCIMCREALYLKLSYHIKPLLKKTISPVMSILYIFYYFIVVSMLNHQMEPFFDWWKYFSFRTYLLRYFRSTKLHQFTVDLNKKLNYSCLIYSTTIFLPQFSPIIIIIVKLV